MNPIKPQSTNHTSSRHQKLLQAVSHVATNATSMGILVNTTEDERLDGRRVQVNSRQMLHFGSCSYLGLEHDDRLKAGAIDAVIKYGTQFSSSRAYLSSRYYEEAEKKLSDIFFGQPVLLLQSLTVGHQSVIPVLVNDEDAILYDARVHDSVQSVFPQLATRGIHIERIRHNDIDMLQSKICELRRKHRKIWYMADGVYSMHGHFAPVRALLDLATSYEELHLYIDDIHGMSWAGPNGSGYVMSQASFHPRLYLATGLTKAFGSAGGVIVFPNMEVFTQVRNTCKAFTFSIQMPPMILGATIASAGIHLTEEIRSFQHVLQHRINLFNDEAIRWELPLRHTSDSPIAFIEVGKPVHGYNIIRRMMNAGYFLNLSVFPSVPLNQTGLRITINRLHTPEDIQNLCLELKYQLQLEAVSDISRIGIQHYVQQIA